MAKMKAKMKPTTPRMNGKGTDTPPRVDQEFDREMVGLCAELANIPTWRELELLRYLARRALEGHVKGGQRVLLNFLLFPETRVTLLDKRYNTPEYRQLYAEEAHKQKERNALYAKVRRLWRSRTREDIKEAAKLSLDIQQLDAPYLTEREADRYILAMIGRWVEDRPAFRGERSANKGA